MFAQILKKLINKKLFALLIDPENYSKESLKTTINLANKSNTDLLLLGGSLVSHDIEKPIEIIKNMSRIPLFLFPGSLLQLSGKADGILLLSLISGRNPEFLIGNHVLAAPLIRSYKLETISTGYMLIGDKTNTAVEYMSNTTPIPANKKEIAVATAMAGEMLGHQLIYLEGGSGTSQPVPEDTIRDVKANLSIPLVVGGGIGTGEDAFRAYKAGADMIVVGNSIEKNPELILDITREKLKFR